MEHPGPRAVNTDAATLSDFTVFGEIKHLFIAVGQEKEAHSSQILIKAPGR